MTVSVGASTVSVSNPGTGTVNGVNYLNRMWDGALSSGTLTCRRTGGSGLFAGLILKR